MNKISFENITKKYRANFWEKSLSVLDEVNFTINQSEVVGFLGANGAGKTTTIKILLGFIKETSGNVIFNGFSDRGRSGFVDVLGYLPEKTYVYQHLTGLEFLHYMGDLHGIKKNDLNDRVKKWSVRLIIDHVLDRQIKDYSKGMQQRLCFLGALLNHPEILVLDEPLSGLDPLGRREFKDIFVELNQNFGTTIFFSSHVVSDVEEICNKVLFIEKGKMLHSGEIEDLIQQKSDNKYRVTYGYNNEIKAELVDEAFKDQMILNLINSGKNIVGVEKNTRTLESVIYDIKEKR